MTREELMLKWDNHPDVFNAWLDEVDPNLTDEQKHTFNVDYDELEKYFIDCGWME